MTSLGSDPARLHERWDDPRNASGLTWLELLTGWTTGIDERAPDIDLVDPLPDPVAALEAALLRLMDRPPVYVAFSGGRDSSVLLAAATRVARREGLPDPVPLTQRFPGVPEADETAWQERVIGHLGLTEWELFESGAELDLVGEVAAGVLRAHGLRYPPASHAHIPMYEHASGGTLVMGDGGDQVFGGWRRVAVGEVLHRRRRPRPRDLAVIANAAAPRPLRVIAETRRSPTPAPWLADWVLREWAHHQGEARAAEPATWPAFLRWTRRERPTVLMLETWELLARERGTAHATPFWDPVFLRSLGAWGGRFGRGSRTRLMRGLFADLLPDDVLARASKARFSRAYFDVPTRRFAEAWDGEIPGADAVDRDQLRMHWLSGNPWTTSATLLQAAWLQQNTRKQSISSG
ncbi:MAG: hypothetical protein JHC95_02165 [Solirubrobacteraceae bacterium]|nr:hypothetical protein [Solirubrobacteraceae bacterium]